VRLGWRAFPALPYVFYLIYLFIGFSKMVIMLKQKKQGRYHRTNKIQGHLIFAQHL